LIVPSEQDDVLPVGMVEKYLEVAKNASKVEHLMLKDTKHRIKLFLRQRNSTRKTYKLVFGNIMNESI